MLSLSPSAGGHVPVLDVVVGGFSLPGLLTVPQACAGVVIFAHGSGSSRFSTRNRQVADALNRAGMATLLFDLLHPAEEFAHNRAKVFDIALLARRLVDAAEWTNRALPKPLPLGFFGASTGAAAALVAAAELGGSQVRAVVSRGGRPDLAGDALEQVRSPTLLIVGGADGDVLNLNKNALQRLKAPSAMEIVPGATHLFPEPGAMEKVLRLAVDWFERYLTASAV